MNWSAEQEAIFEWFANGSGSLVVQARAGTGKTTTIKEAFTRAPENRMLYAVFNKRNQKEAEAKIKDSRVEVRTLHSLGFAFIKRVWSDAKPNDDVEFDRARAVLAPRDDREVISALVKLVSYAKNTSVNPTAAELEQLAQSKDVDAGEKITARELAELAFVVLGNSRIKDSQARISFDDMVWLPVAMGWVRPWYKLVCVDEAQDMNLPQLLMAKGAVEQGGRVCVVGDNRQAIYGFRGAAQNGMGMMKITLRAKELGLTTTYRCPKSVVRIAAEIVPDYKAADSAPEGSVSNINDAAMIAQIAKGDALLSRMNAPLLPTALMLLRKNIPVRIEGRDIGKQLIALVKSMKAFNVENFIERVNAWRTKQSERVADSNNAEKKLEQINDMAETLIALTDHAETVADIEARINSLFQDTYEDSKPAVVLSSVHKAKGLEWERVFLLTETFRRGKGQEEDNIYYVAVTRAKHSLFFVSNSRENAQPIQNKPIEQTGAMAPATQSEPEIIAWICDCGAKNDIERNTCENCDRFKSEARGGGDDVPPAATPVMSSNAQNEPDSFALLPGSKFYEVGMVRILEKMECVCLKVNNSGASFVPLTESRSTFEVSEFETDGEEVVEKKRKVSIAKKRRTIRICNSYDPRHEEIIRILNADEMKEFLEGGKVRPRIKNEVAEQAAETETNNNGETDMNKKKKGAKRTKTGGTKTAAVYTGQADYIRKLKADGTPLAEAIAKTKEKFPGSSETRIRKVWGQKPSETKPTKASKPAAKAPAKKSTPPARKPAATKAPKRKAPPARKAAPVAEAPASAPIVTEAPAVNEEPTETAESVQAPQPSTDGVSEQMGG